MNKILALILALMILAASMSVAFAQDKASGMGGDATITILVLAAVILLVTKRRMANQD